MKRIKRIVRLVSFMIVIVLASIGAGIAGALPIFQHKRRENDNEFNIEMMDEEDKDGEEESELN